MKAAFVCSCYIVSRCSIPAPTWTKELLSNTSLPLTGLPPFRSRTVVKSYLLFSDIIHSLSRLCSQCVIEVYVISTLAPPSSFLLYYDSTLPLPSCTLPHDTSAPIPVHVYHEVIEKHLPTAVAQTLFVAQVLRAETTGTSKIVAVGKHWISRWRMYDWYQWQARYSGDRNAYT